MSDFATLTASPIAGFRSPAGRKKAIPVEPIIEHRPRPRNTSGKCPEGAEVVTTYDRMHSTLDMFIHGEQDLVCILGKPGTGKSQSAKRYLKRSLGNDFLFLKGKVSPIKFYEHAYTYVNRPICLDDVDSMMRDKDTFELMKALCDTDPVKTISWETQNKNLAKAGIPLTFKTTSKVCILANSWPTQMGSSEAVANRAEMIYFDPTPAEMIRYVATWFRNDEVFEFMKLHFLDFRQQDVRMFTKADGIYRTCQREGRPETYWKEMILQKWSIAGDLAKDVAFQLLMDTSFATDVERIAVWKKRTGYKSDRQFKNYKEEFLAEDRQHYAASVAEIELIPVDDEVDDYELKVPADEDQEDDRD